MPILLFDGHCNLCNSWIKFIIKRDPAKKIRFAQLQSNSGKEILVKNNIDEKYIDSLVYIEDSNYYFNSTAAIKILSILNGWVRYLKFLIIIPLPIRDFLYRVIAKYRYKIFGRLEKCMIPSDDYKERFL